MPNSGSVTMSEVVAKGGGSNAQCIGDCVAKW